MKPEEVILSFTPFQAQYILSQPLHHSQKIISQNEKEVRISLNVYLTQELTMAVLSYGTGVKVIKPAKFRESIGRIAKELAAMYGPHS